MSTKVLDHIMVEAVMDVTAAIYKCQIDLNGEPDLEQL